jgi:hypothetical protein
MVQIPEPVRANGCSPTTARNVPKRPDILSIFARNWSTDVRPSWSTRHETLGQFPTINGATMTLIFIKAIGR